MRKKEETGVPAGMAKNFSYSSANSCMWSKFRDREPQAGRTAAQSWKK